MALFAKLVYFMLVVTVVRVAIKAVCTWLVYYLDATNDLDCRHLWGPLAIASERDGGAGAFMSHMQIGNRVNGSFLVRSAV